MVGGGGGGRARFGPPPPPPPPPPPQGGAPTIQMSVKYLSIVTELQYTVLSNLKCLKKPALLIIK